MQGCKLLVACGSAFAFLAGVAAPAAAQQSIKPYDKTIKVRVPEDKEKPWPVVDASIGLGGFVKADALYSFYSDGDVASPGGMRDFYVPSGIPVASSTSAEQEHSHFDLHAKETRMFFKIDAHVYETKLGGYLEFDFISSPGAGNEVVTNAYAPALRRAFITYNDLLIGQDWTTFQNLGSIPDSVDFVRWPSEGTVFGRQPLVRYTLSEVLGGEFQFALENAETTVLRKSGTSSGATPVTGAFTTGDAQMPDAVVRYNWKPSFGEFSAALLARQLIADNASTGGDAPNNVAHGTATGAGLSLSGKVPAFGSDDVRFMLTAGEGIGRYVALGTSADTVVSSDNGLDPIPVVAGFVAYRHHWNDRWRSSAMVSTLQVDNDTALTGTGVTRSVVSGRVNVLYNPVDKLTFGLEFTHAMRELENGEDGAMDRLQFSTIYVY